jgi:hypothetical protein
MALSAWQIKGHQPLTHEAIYMKKLILSLMTLSALGIMIGAPVQANAREINIGGYQFSDHHLPRGNARYAVYFKTERQKHWQYKGEYGNRFEAEYSANRLRDRGYVARIDRY